MSSFVSKTRVRIPLLCCLFWPPLRARNAMSSLVPYHSPAPTTMVFCTLRYSYRLGPSETKVHTGLPFHSTMEKNKTNAHKEAFPFLLSRFSPSCPALHCLWRRNRQLGPYYVSQLQWRCVEYVSPLVALGLSPSLYLMNYHSYYNWDLPLSSKLVVGYTTWHTFALGYFWALSTKWLNNMKAWPSGLLFRNTPFHRTRRLVDNFLIGEPEWEHRRRLTLVLDLDADQDQPVPLWPSVAKDRDQTSFVSFGSYSGQLAHWPLLTHFFCQEHIFSRISPLGLLPS